MLHQVHLSMQQSMHRHCAGAAKTLPYFTFGVDLSGCPEVMLYSSNSAKCAVPCLHSSTAFAQKIWGFCMQDTTGLQVSS